MIDAVIITNFNAKTEDGSNHQGIKLVAFDFSLNSKSSIVDFTDDAMKNVNN